MPLPEPERALRHRGPALLVGAIEECTGTMLRCTSRDAGPWRWARLLEGAAQTAGLLAGLQDDGLRDTAVIAEYRAVRIHAPRHVGPVRFVAHLDRRVLRFRRCRIAVHGADGTLLLDGGVTLAPGTGAATTTDVPPVDPRVYAILAEAGFAGEPFNPRQHRSCELVERYSLELTIALLDGLGLRAPLAAWHTVEELRAACGFAATFDRPLGWLLARLALAGIVAGDGSRYRLCGALPAPRLDALRAEVLASDPSYAPALALLDEAAAAWPRVATGETTGEKALFQKLGLWPAYFSNRNGYYALNNRVAAAAVAARLPPAGARVLEVGAGLGSATEALLEALGRPLSLAGYRFTEPVAFFRRRAERALAEAWPELSLAGGALDLNAPWAAQGVAPASCDLVWGVNAFHLARDLDATLREAYAALAPGGWLVAGEGLRPVAGEPVGAELPFQLLDAFRDVRTDPVTRPAPGFLTAEQWIAACARAGFAPVELVPDAVRLRALHPAFFAAAVCARRP